MEEKQASVGNLPLESSLTDLILRPNSEKIRRPPNAFMLFARDHRKIMAQRHPDVSNKVISSMLGKIWKGAADSVKQKYFEKSRMLDDMHKSRYPNYIYSPREARLQKMNKKRKKDNISAIVSKMTPRDLNELVKNSKREVQPIKEENWATDTTSQDTKPILPQYNPNNPQYFIQQSPETNNEDDPNLPPIFRHESQFQEQTSEMPMNIHQRRTDEEIDCRWPMMPESCGCCTQDVSEFKGKCIPPYVRGNDEVEPPYPPNHLRPSHPPFFNSSAHFSGHFRPFCYDSTACTRAMPRYYPPAFRFNPYWGSSAMNTPFQSRGCRCEDVKPFSYHAPYHTPGFNRHSFGYFGRPVAAPHTGYPNSGIYPHSHENLERLRGQPNEFASGNPETYPCDSNSNEKEENSSKSHASSASEETVNFEIEDKIKEDEQNYDCSVPLYKSEPTPVELKDSSSSTCAGGSYYPPMRFENPYEKYNEMNYFIQNPEDCRKECCAGNQVVGNKMECESYLADLDGNKVQAACENISSSVTSSSLTNTYEYNVEKDINSLEASNPKPYEPPNIALLESTQSCIKTNTGIRPFLASKQFQRIFYRSCQPIRMPTDRSLRHSPISNKTNSDIGSSIKEAMNIIKDDPSTNLEPEYIDTKKYEEIPIKGFNTVPNMNIENLQKVETNDTLTSAQTSVVKAETMKAETMKAETFSSVMEAETHFSVTKAEIKSSNSCSSKDINKGICVIEVDKKEGKKCISNASDEHSDNLSKNLMCANASKSNSKIYYKQKDGSYVAEEKLPNFNTFK